MSFKFKTIAGAGLACALFALTSYATAQDYNDDPQTQIDRLSEQLRTLTGQNEELQHQNQVLQQQLQQLQAGGAPARDASGRNGPASQQQSPSQGQVYQNQPYPNQPPQSYQQAPINAPYNDNPPPNAASSGGRRGDAFDPSQNPNAPGVPRALGGGQLPINPNAPPGAPLNLEAAPQGGYAPEQQAPQQPAPGAAASLTTAPPTSSPRDEFDLGIGYMQRKDYGLAAETMRNFIAKYPTERLVGDAQYWLGESLFQRQQYRDAAEAFLQVTSKYDRSAKAPDALLRLGQSLAALKQKDAACASFGEIARKYPKASSGVKQGVVREQKRTGC
ncbi:MAG: tol-pal system protein YbgF [Xanthobacteraceae bacterium]|nr:tol-pal system protein YbgF [Xanthobacteraceae bacterium]